MSKLQLQCLKALIEFLEDSEEGCYSPFAPVMDITGLDRKTVRRSIRALARKGYTEYSNGLCNDEGSFRGSGYRPTQKGKDFVRKPTEQKEKL